VETAIRELAEECGIRLVRESIESTLCPMEARRRTGPYVLVAPFAFRVATELPTVVDPREAVEARWIPLSTLRDPARHRLQCVPGQPKAVLYPAIEFDATPLWGFTYRLLTEWLALGPQQSMVARAGFEAGDCVLRFLLDHGLSLAQNWTGADTHHSPHKTAKIATVRGRIPDAAVLAQFSVPGSKIPSVNLLEARPDYVRVVDLAFEEYLIQAID
jgi:hypothetical protein